MHVTMVAPRVGVLMITYMSVHAYYGRPMQ